MSPQRTTSKRTQPRRRKDGTPAKPPARVPLRYIEAFLAEHASLQPAPRHRPRKGTVTLVQAIMQRFEISRSTAMRSLRELARQQAEEQSRIVGPLTPEAAGFLAAIARQYQGRVVPGKTVSGGKRETVSDKIQGSHSLVSQELTQSPVSASPLPQITEDDLVNGIIAYLQRADPTTLARVRNAVPAARPEVEVSGRRGLDAIGLHVVSSPSPAPANPGNSASTFDAGESLLEAMDAYESMRSVPEAWAKVWAWLRSAVETRKPSA